MVAGGCMTGMPKVVLKASTCRRFVLCWSAVLLICAALPVDAALTFNFNVPDAGKAPSAQALAGFNEAAAAWSAIFTDNVTLNYDLYWEPLSAGVLGSASSEFASFSYSSVSSALVADATSPDDSTATSNLPGGSSFDIFINRTSNNPNGANSSTGYVDSSTTDLDGDSHSNNNTIRMTRANAKALGLISGSDGSLDATIRFSSTFSFDFSHASIDGDKIDFVGVAMHEIGHSLGFTSGVDILDMNGSGFLDDQFDYVSTMDLFRYSPGSVAAGGVGTIDWTAGASEKSFSLDGGSTRVTGVTFSTGSTLGDGQQASHFKDNLGLGLMDPTTGFGEKIDPGNNDVRVLDAIGWDPASPLSGAATETLASESGSGGGGAPEPSVLPYLTLPAVALYLTGRSSRSRVVEEGDRAA